MTWAFEFVPGTSQASHDRRCNDLLADDVGPVSSTWHHLSGSTSLAAPAQAADAAGSAAHADRASNEGEGDVYMVDEEEGPGVWEVTVTTCHDLDVIWCKCRS